MYYVTWDEKDYTSIGSTIQRHRSFDCLRDAKAFAHGIQRQAGVSCVRIDRVTGYNTSVPVRM